MSMPFDWLGQSSFRTRMELVRDDFVGYLTLETMETEPKMDPFKNEVHVFDKHGFVYAHDFKVDIPVAEQLPVVRERFMRRRNRLEGILRKSHRALVIWADVAGLSPAVSDSDLQFAYDVMSKKWANCAFDILAFRMQEGVAISDAKEVDSGHVKSVYFDYRDTVGDGVWMAHIPLLQKWLSSRYEVVDYRTNEEKAAWAKQRVRQKYAEYHAESYVRYLVNKMNYKLYKHFRTRVIRAGIINAQSGV